MIVGISLLALTTSSSAAVLRSPLLSHQLASRGLAGPRMAVQGGAYSFSANDLDTNKAVDLSKYKGSVSLVVNVASK